MGRFEVLCCLGFKALVGLLLIGICGSGMTLGMAWYSAARAPYAKVTARQVAVVQGTFDQVQHLSRQAKKAVDFSNFRLANGRILHELLKEPYPADNSYNLEKFSIHGGMMVVSQPAPAAGEGSSQTSRPKNETTPFYVAEFTWNVGVSTVTERVQSISTNILMGMRPDFSSTAPVNNWVANSDTAQNKAVTSTGIDIWSVVMTWQMQAPRDLFRPTAKNRESDVQKYLVKYHTP